MLLKHAWTGLEIMRKDASLVSAVETGRVSGLNFQEVFMWPDETDVRVRHAI